MKMMQRSLSGWRLPLVALPLLAVVFGLTLATMARANAATVFNVTFPVSFIITNPCNGEVVPISGNEHDTFHLTFDGSGGVHFDLHANFEDVTGTGSFGNTYQVPGAFVDSVNARVGSEATDTQTFNFISQGSAPNFLLHVDDHITVHPDGTVTSFHDNFRTTCQG